MTRTTPRWPRPLLALALAALLGGCAPIPAIVGGVVVATSGGGGGGGGGAVPSLPGVEVVAAIGPAGGTLSHPSGTAITVPPGALSGTVDIRVASGVRDVADGSVLRAIGPAFSFRPEGLVFALPAQVRLPIDPALIPAGLLDADLVALQRNDVTGSVTELRPTTVDRAGRFLLVTVTSFSSLQPAVGQTGSRTQRGRRGRLLWLE